ncbi:LAMI_0E16006g1_1 [Lachancea mirantina]|uniref:LAMI_0E16006g1_1 n=1 Tax=Lachancea mirantina TaxID=1230905 RepID=A0A1G4JSR6_9SACH|nr:LAMI_0E16006g1_1 [Lachancea mirantina]
MSAYENREKCHFYYKIGACRHGDRCSKKHTRPVRSCTIVIPNMYRADASEQDQQRDFDAFFEDVYIEASKFGEVRSMVVCENKNDHLNGNVYIIFSRPQDAQAVRDSFNTRWYDSRPLYCDLSHVSGFHDAICRKHDMQACERGDECNFMHVHRPSPALLQDLEWAQQKKYQMGLSVGQSRAEANRGR